MQPTHINAYYAELAEAEKDLAGAQTKVDQLKETIATMEQAAKAADPNAPSEESTETPEEQEVEKLERLKRPELEKKAKAAGVADPSAAKNKEELAKETVAAQNDSAPADEPAPADQPAPDVAAADASLPSTDNGAPVDKVPSQPITETPNDASDMPPVSSEVPAAGAVDDSVPQPGAQDVPAPADSVAKTPEEVAADQASADHAASGNPSDPQS